MKKLLIHAWEDHPWRLSGSSGPDALTVEGVVKRLEAVADAKEADLARLSRRLVARFPSSIRLREDADPEEFISWLRKAGAVVAVSSG
jgi:phosphoserine phosphatase